VSLTLPSICRGSRHRAAVWHIAALPSSHVTRDRDGYLVTSVARTAADLAAGLALPEALVILDAAARLLVESFVTSAHRPDYVNPRLVRAVREGLSEAVGRRWRSRLMTAIGCVEPCRESAPESLAAGHLHLSGLPMPEFQAKIVTPKGTFYPDCYWREERLIGECDGKVKYSSRDDIVAEKWREQVLRDEGHRFVRWLGGEIMSHPGDVMARIARALSV
jgi:very-short-patch-repair endonuclease